MNDPGLDENVQSAAQDLEHHLYEHDQLEEEREEQDFLDPRYAPTTTVFESISADVRAADGGSHRQHVLSLPAPSGPWPMPSRSALWSKTGGYISLKARPKHMATQYKTRHGRLRAFL